jgi:hypothetical protein
MEKKLDEILKNQGIIIQMLTDLIEAIPAPDKRGPDMQAAFAPLINSPMIKSNPVLAGMLDDMIKNMGGKP